MNDSSKNLFEQETRDILNKIRMAHESISDCEDYDFFTNTGLARLNIPANSYIDIKYIGEDNLQAFRQIIFPKNFKLRTLRTIDFSRLYLICNLTSKRINNLLERLPIGKEINVISIDDLRNVEISLLNEGGVSQTLDWPKIRPNKSIQYEQFNDFLLTLIRLEIIMAAFPRGNANMQNIIAQKDSLLPFSYEDYDGQSHIFISEASRYTKRSVLFEEKAIIHKVDINSTEEEVTMLIIDGNASPFNKISISWFGKSIGFFNSYARIAMLPNKPQFKYRRFGKTSEEEFDINKDEYAYTRKVIENNEIYFSTKSQLNDPFDLDADYFGKPYDFASNSYRIFCTTGDNDNILMWSHYGDSHSGYCTSYYPPDIISEIEKEAQIEFCIYGYVNYSPKRKTNTSFFKLIYSCFDDETISFILQINQLFKKFSDWSYEKEFRYIICLNRKYSNNEAEVGVPIKVSPIDYYFGQKFDFNKNTIPYLKRFIGDSCFTFNLSKTEYKLEKIRKKL